MLRLYPRIQNVNKLNQGCDMVTTCSSGLLALLTVDNIFGTEANTTVRQLMDGRRYLSRRRSILFMNINWLVASESVRHKIHSLVPGSMQVTVESCMFREVGAKGEGRGRGQSWIA